MNGRRRDMRLGPYPDVSLAKARERALDARRLVKIERRDPLAACSRLTALTFKAAAEALIETKRSGWRNAKHADQWGSTLATYAYPRLGKLDVNDIDARDVLDVLRPILGEKPVTASGVRQRIEAVLNYAAAI